MNLLYISWRNLRSKPLTAGLNVLLVGLGMAIITLLNATTQQLDEGLKRNIRGIDMVVGAKGSPLQIILASVYHMDAPTGNIAQSESNRLRKHPLVEQVIPLGYGDSYQGFRIVGSETSYPAHYQAELATGDWWAKPMEVTVGSEAAKQLGLTVGDSFTSTHGLQMEGHAHDHRQFEVVGIMQPTGTVIDRLLLTSIESIWAVHDLDQVPDSARQITAMLVQFKSKMGMMTIPRAINEESSLQAALPAIEVPRLLDLLGAGTEVLQWLAIILVIVAGISIFVALFNALKQRKYEVALMRSMGISGIRIFMLFQLEALWIGLFGGLLGLICGRLATMALASYADVTWPVALASGISLVEVAALGSVVLLCALAALLPSVSAVRMNIADTLAER